MSMIYSHLSKKSAEVAELEYAQVSEACSERIKGSSPFFRIKELFKEEGFEAKPSATGLSETGRFRGSNCECSCGGEKIPSSA